MNILLMVHAAVRKPSIQHVYQLQDVKQNHWGWRQSNNSLKKIHEEFMEFNNWYFTKRLPKTVPKFQGYVFFKGTLLVHSSLQKQPKNHCPIFSPKRPKCQKTLKETFLHPPNQTLTYHLFHSPHENYVQCFDILRNKRILLIKLLRFTITHRIHVWYQYSCLHENHKNQPFM